MGTLGVHTKGVGLWGGGRGKNRRQRRGWGREGTACFGTGRGPHPSLKT